MTVMTFHCRFKTNFKTANEDCKCWNWKMFRNRYVFCDAEDRKGLTWRSNSSCTKHILIRAVLMSLPSPWTMFWCLQILASQTLRRDRRSDKGDAAATTSQASSEIEIQKRRSFKMTERVERGSLSGARLYGTDDGVAVSLSHDADLAAIRTRPRTDVTLDHGAVPLLHHHWTEFAALASRRLVASRACPLREDPLERLSEFSVEDAVDYRVEGRVTVAEPRENLSGKNK